MNCLVDGETWHHISKRYLLRCDGDVGCEPGDLGIRWAAAHGSENKQCEDSMTHDFKVLDGAKQVDLWL